MTTVAIVEGIMFAILLGIITYGYLPEKKKRKP